jgi:hypothetical protein
MIVPSTRIFTAGEIETGAYLNSAVTNMGNFMLGKPVTFLRQTANQSLTVSAYTAITWGVADVNRDNNWSSSANTLWTCNTAGWYQFAGGGSFASTATAVSNRGVWWFKTPSGGSATNLSYGYAVDRVSVTSTPMPITAQSIMAYMNVGDAMDLRLYTTASTTTTNSSVTGYNCWMSAQWVSL